MGKTNACRCGGALSNEQTHSGTTVTTSKAVSHLVSPRDHEQSAVRGVMPAICIVVENAPVPPDRRVWREARALTEAGYRVSVISPKALGFSASHETLDGVEIYRHRTWEARRRLGYLIEYPWALICEFLLALKIYARTRFRVMHGCNPPDSSFLIGTFFKLLGVRFIFDHHDLSPELYEDKFGKGGLLYRLVCLFERLTFRAADVSVATNESYREVAVKRGGMSPDRVFVVRNCQDIRQVRRQAPRPELKKGKSKLVVYLGVMGAQDRVDLLIESVALIVQRDLRQDTHFVLIGSGTEVPRLKQIVTEKGLDSFVDFTGWMQGQELEDYLSTADIAVAPEPATVLNDKSTMTKVLHYMAYGLPIVQYDLTEGRRSAGDASFYAHNDDPEEFAAHITRLLDSESLRKQLGECGRRRVEERLNWEIEKHELLRAYSAALQPNVHRPARRRACCAREALAAAGGREFQSGRQPGREDAGVAADSPAWKLDLPRKDSHDS